MGMLTIQPEAPPASFLDRWLQNARHEIDAALGRILERSEEPDRDRRWAGALEEARLYTIRPAKRLRPALLLAGFGLGGGTDELPPGLWQFAAGIEILHTFTLIHDDVADGAETRRGGPALHRTFAAGKIGEDLAVVMGDYLFARSIEVMLASGLPRAPEAVQYYLRICREAAVGQYMDLDLTRVPLREITLFQALKVAKLKTAKPSFAAPLVAGGVLARANPAAIEALSGVGHQMGLAFQLRDDLLGLFGKPDVAGKPCNSDLTQGKRTFPLIAAYVRAPQPVKQELEDLWSGRMNGDGSLTRAQELVEAYGGRRATQRAVDRASGAARRILKRLPADNHLRHLLSELINTLSRRDH